MGSPQWRSQQRRQRRQERPGRSMTRKPGPPETGVSRSASGLTLFDSAGASSVWLPTSNSDLVAWYEAELPAGHGLGMVPSGTNGVHGVTLVSDDFEGHSTGDTVDGTDTNGPTGVDALTYNEVAADLDYHEDGYIYRASGSVNDPVVVPLAQDVTVEASLHHSDTSSRMVGVALRQPSGPTNPNSGIIPHITAGEDLILDIEGVEVARAADVFPPQSVVPVDFTMVASVWRDRIRVWIDGTPGTDAPDIDYYMTADEMASIAGDIYAGPYINRAGPRCYSWSARTVDPAVDFQQVYDTFTDTGGTAIESHTPELNVVGGAWPDRGDIDAGGTFWDGIGGDDIVRALDTALSDVWIDATVTLTNNSGGIGFRSDTDDPNHFLSLRVVNNGEQVVLAKVEAEDNVTTLVDVTGLSLGVSPTVQLQVLAVEDQVWAWVDGDLLIEHTLSADDYAEFDGEAHGPCTHGNGNAMTMDEIVMSEPPMVSVAPDLSGQHNHATQTQDGSTGAFLSGEGLVLPGVSGNFATAPDSAALSITGDIDIQCRVSMADWTPDSDSETFVGKWESSGDERSFAFRVTTGGNLQLVWSENGLGGGGLPTETSSVATGLTDGDEKWVRVTMDVDNGSSDADIKFWTADDSSGSPGSWTQLGSTQNHGSTTSIYDGTALFSVGAFSDDGSDDMVNGTIKRVIVYPNLTESSAAFDADFTGKRGATSFTEDSSNGATVTVNTSLADLRPVRLPGVTDGGTAAMVVASSPTLITGGLSGYGTLTEPYTAALSILLPTGTSSAASYLTRQGNNAWMYLHPSGADDHVLFGGLSTGDDDPLGEDSTVIGMANDPNSKIIVNGVEGASGDASAPGTPPNSARLFANGNLGNPVPVGSRIPALVITDDDSSADSDLQAHLDRHRS